MNENNDLLIDLEALSALQMDSINGFKHLHEKVADPVLKKFFMKCEEQSLELWNGINDEIIKLRGDIQSKGTVKGALNHIWMKMKTDIVHSDMANVLKNIEICEEFNITRYKSVLAEALPDNIRIKLEKQLEILTARMQSIVLLKENLEK